MFSFRGRSFRWRSTLAATLASGVALLLAFAVGLAYDRVSFRRAMVRDLSTLGQVLGDNSTAALTFADARSAREILGALRAKPAVVRAFLFGRDGRVLASYGRDASTGREAVPAVEREGAFFARDRLLLFRRISLDGNQLGTLYLESDLSEAADRLRNYAALAGVGVLASAAVGWLLSWKLQAVLSRPILNLAAAARSVSASRDYSVRVTREGEDEVAFLTDAFNEMLAQIQERDVALRAAHDDLETRVAERTRELRQEVVERMQAENALRQSEEQLRQAQKMEAIGRLAGGIAHDFNNLLTAISGYTELLLAELQGRLRSHAEEVHKASGRAAALTRQLLAFSRRQVLAPKVLDPNAMVSGIDKMLRRLIGEHIELVTHLQAAPWRVKADPGQIDQVLMNLAVNARDAMPGGGTLLLETANVELDAAYARRRAMVRPGPYVLLAVTDTGSGMDAATCARVFEPFFTTKEKGKGTGLGLSTVYGIVKQSGGYVWAYSELGRGTTFKIYLPRAAEEGEPAESPVSAAAPSAGTETLLLVEDEPQVRALAAEILRRRGYRVLEAEHGADALVVAQGHDGPIQLMVTDMVMPKMNGRELYERLGPQRPDMRVLYMSGYTETGIVRQGALEEGTAFLQKPFSAAALARKVRDVLDGLDAAEASSGGPGGPLELATAGAADGPQRS